MDTEYLPLQVGPQTGWEGGMEGTEWDGRWEEWESGGNEEVRWVYLILFIIISLIHIPPFFPKQKTLKVALSAPESSSPSQA